jgi:hypothetical protein
LRSAEPASVSELAKPTGLTLPAVMQHHMHLAGLLISLSLATVEIAPDGDGTKLTFTEHATFLNGYDDPCAANRKQGSDWMRDRVGQWLAL